MIKGGKRVNDPSDLEKFMDGGDYLLTDDSILVCHL